MAKKGEVIVIKKKKKGGGHGHHGGAWKVAYADFVTAMMCFFLVMWLMGSDEEIKAAVAHYFNNPNTPFKAGTDTKSKESVPLGEYAGAGDNVLNGKEGQFPDELARNPMRPVAQQRLEEHQELSELIKELMDGKVYALGVSVESLKFSVESNLLFKPGTEELKPEGKPMLDKLGRLFNGYRGYLVIEGHVDESQFKSNVGSAYEFSVSQAVSVMNYLIGKHYISEEKTMPRGSGARRQLASDGDDRTKNQRIEFTMSYTAP